MMYIEIILFGSRVQPPKMASFRHLARRREGRPAFLGGRGHTARLAVSETAVGAKPAGAGRPVSATAVLTAKMSDRLYIVRL